MKSVQDRLSQTTHPSPKSYQQLFQEIVSDPEVAAFIKKEGLTQQEITLSISKFLEYISQRDLFVKQDESYIAKGYQPVLVMNEGYADVSYLETEELVEYRRLEAIKNRIQLINMPASLKNVTVADIDKSDENRVEVMLAIADFVKRFEEKPKVFTSMVTLVLEKLFDGLFSQFVIQDPSSINHHAPLSDLCCRYKKCYQRRFCQGAD